MMVVCSALFLHGGFNLDQRPMLVAKRNPAPSSQ